MRLLALFTLGIAVLISPLTLAKQDKAIFAYYKQWAIYSPNYHINDVPGAQITHLVYQSANINAKGKVLIGNEYADINHAYPGDNPANTGFSGSFGQMLILKTQHPQLKTLISIGGWGRSEHYSSIAADPRLRINFANSVIAFMQKYQFDGIEIDWNYPITSNLVLNSSRDTDPENYTLLLKEIRQRLDSASQRDNKKYLLISTISTAPDYEKTWQVKQVSDVLDYISLSTAYMHGWWETTTNHITPLQLASQTALALESLKVESNSIAKATSKVLNLGADPNKIVLNIASFATGWVGVPNTNNGLYQQAELVAWGSWDSADSGRTGLYDRGHLTGFLDNPNYQHLWDDEAHMPWIYNPEKLDGHFVSYENSRSLSGKVNFIKENRLAGIGIRQIHNDVKGADSIIRQTHALIHPWQALWFKAAAFYASYKVKIWMTLGFFILLLILLYRIKRQQRKEESSDVDDRNQYLKLKSQLQQLNVPLQGIASLTSQLDSRDLPLQTFSQQNLAHIGATGHQLNFLVHNLLYETTLAQSPRIPEPKPLAVAEMINTCGKILAPQYLYKGVTLDLQLEQSSTIIADEAYLQKLLLTLLSNACERSLHGQQVTLTLINENNQTQINIQDQAANHKTSISQVPNMLLIKQCVTSLGGEISFDTHEQLGQACMVRLSSCALPAQNSQGVLTVLQQSADETTDNQTRPAMTSRLKSLQLFSSQATQLKDIQELVKEAFELFVKDPLKPSVTVYQGENILHTNREEEEEEADSLTISHPDLGEYRFELSSHSPLNEEDIYYFHSLVAQIQMVRRQLHEMAKEPQLLCELYEVASRKEKLNYIKAEKGYSGVYANGEANPVYLSLRLKTIKLYFDDDVLLQIHRSYLVNPRKVLKVNQLTKLKHEIELENIKLPVARPYVPVLKQHFPHWFS